MAILTTYDIKICKCIKCGSRLQGIVAGNTAICSGCHTLHDIKHVGCFKSDGFMFGTAVGVRLSDIDAINKRNKRKREYLKLNSQEIQSGLNRVSNAEGLIEQLPVEHEGRCTWLLNYGVRYEAAQRRKNRSLHFHESTMSAELRGKK